MSLPIPPARLLDRPSEDEGDRLPPLSGVAFALLASMALWGLIVFVALTLF